jgi:16S rRNA U516 pseudouridylate synthase RsuA-like enzyme
VQVNGVVQTDLAVKVNHGDVVLLDHELLRASPRAAVLLNKPYGSTAEIVHPPELHVVMPLRLIERGAELLIADPELARRIADPRHPQAQLRDGRRRLAYAGLAVEDLDPGEWRPLGHKELERLRRSVHLPPRA